MKGIGYGKSDVGDGVAEEGEQPRDELDERERAGLEEADALREGNEFTCRSKIGRSRSVALLASGGSMSITDRADP